MITVSASLAAVLSLPAIEPRFFVDIETGSGTWYVSNERLTWGGNSYQARLATIPSVQTDLGPPGLVGPHDVSIDIANADGAWSQYRPQFFQGRMLTIKQGFREVDSEGIWQMKFKMTSARVVSPEVFRLEAADLLTEARRALVPCDSLTITRSLFLNIPEDSPGLGKPIPISFGKCITEAYLIEEQASGVSGAGAKFVTRLSGPFAPSGEVMFQKFNNELIRVNSFATSVILLPDVGSVAIVNQASSPRVAGVSELVPHHIFETRDQTPEGAGHFWPDRALLTLLTHRCCGNLDATMLVDSDNWASARSIWVDQSTEFFGAMTEQKPLQDWLDDWAFSAGAHILFRDKLRIVVQDSRATVYSFHTGNILAGTVTTRDVPVEELNTTQTVVYQRIMQPTAAVSAQIVDTTPRTRATYSATSFGSTAVRETPFLGDERSALHAAEVWARRDRFGRREYAFEASIRAALLEEGDLVTLVHTLYCSSVQLCEVVGLTRGETVGVRLREASASTFLRNAPQPGLNNPSTRSALVSYGGGNQAINATPSTFTSSHPLTIAPSFVVPILLPRFIGDTVTSFVSATVNNFTVALASQRSYNANDQLQAFLVRV